MAQPLQDLHHQESAVNESAQKISAREEVITMQMLLPLSRILGSFVFDPV